MRNIDLSAGISLINKRFSKNQYYHYLKEVNNVLVIPVINNQFIIVEQKRIPINKKNFEFPVGRVDLGESNIKAANRELLEETGYKARAPLIKLVSFFADPGRNIRKVYCYYTKDLELVSKPEKGIKIHLVKKKRIEELISNNKFNNAFNIAAFYFFLYKNL
jgi:ADP-ribose pyrophosphatase